MRRYDKKSILEMAGGKIREMVDREMGKLLDNITDEGTAPGEKRKLTLTVELKPDQNRRVIAVAVNCKTALAPVCGVGTGLVISTDDFGQTVAVELDEEVPGQLDMDQDEQEPRAALRIVRG